MAGGQTTYKVKKGDTLSGIAKKHRHKSWKTIWDDPANKKVKSQRKKPELIREGDEFVIPPNEAEQKKKQAEIDKAAAAVAQEQVLGVHLSARGATIEAAAKAVGGAMSKGQKPLKLVRDELDKLLLSAPSSVLISGTQTHYDIKTCQALVIGQLAIALTLLKVANKEVKKQNTMAGKLATGVVTEALSKESKKAADTLMTKKCGELDDLSAAIAAAVPALEKVMKSAHWKTAHKEALKFTGGERQSIVALYKQYQTATQTLVAPITAKIALASVKAVICQQQGKAALTRSKTGLKELAKTQKAMA